ncbi:unnamed protein product [Soboliphyme baturini]|uniref:Uncharacterized protein n=1 Tax=Soboliphyme baturini TaxID=241478 RepID=A0A183ISU0_9BILA|nr:unnamed protein product [Soboliphyme baturini]
MKHQRLISESLFEQFEPDNDIFNSWTTTHSGSHNESDYFMQNANGSSNPPIEQFKFSNVYKYDSNVLELIQLLHCFAVTLKIEKDKRWSVY